MNTTELGITKLILEYYNYRPFHDEFRIATDGMRDYADTFLTVPRRIDWSSNPGMLRKVRKRKYWEFRYSKTRKTEYNHRHSLCFEIEQYGKNFYYRHELNKLQEKLKFTNKNTPKGKYQYKKLLKKIRSLKNRNLIYIIGKRSSNKKIFF